MFVANARWADRPRVHANRRVSMAAANPGGWTFDWDELT